MGLEVDYIIVIIIKSSQKWNSVFKLECIHVCKRRIETDSRIKLYLNYFGSSSLNISKNVKYPSLVFLLSNFHPHSPRQF